MKNLINDTFIQHTGPVKYDTLTHVAFCLGSGPFMSDLQPELLVHVIVQGAFLA